MFYSEWTEGCVTVIDCFCFFRLNMYPRSISSVTPKIKIMMPNKIATIAPGPTLDEVLLLAFTETVVTWRNE